MSLLAASIPCVLAAQFPCCATQPAARLHKNMLLTQIHGTSGQGNKFACARAAVAPMRPLPSVEPLLKHPPFLWQRSAYTSFCKLGLRLLWLVLSSWEFLKTRRGFALRPTMLSALLWGGRILHQRVFARKLLGPSFAVWPRP